jgi:hypothetical protein
MTGHTFGIAVFAKQRKSREAMIKENVLRPRVLIVAVFANRSLGALVRIVVLMAQAAGRRRLSVEHGLDVTGGAFDSGVRTAKGVLRIDVVIESQSCPLCGYVAGVTAFAKVSLVIVIVVMAGVAGCV